MARREPIAIPKGLFDILPASFSLKEEAWRHVEHWQKLEDILHTTARQYAYQEVRLPIFEHTELFARSSGESSDIVSKEMYTFLDKGERSLTLRPEGTAGVVRAYIEKQAYAAQDFQKVYYIGPMFRYSRPQAGRYREFYQFGAEAFGFDSPQQDIELIDMLWTVYHRLGLKDLRLLINSIGDMGCRDRYREALQNYLRPHFNLLSADSQIRFEMNPLRILDSKDPQDQALLKGAPCISDSLESSTKDHFEEVLAGLDALGIPYEVCPSLVRGLDYYNRTVFEITPPAITSQNTLGAGGRYDDLVASLGGPKTPAIGFASGFERVLQAYLEQHPEKRAATTLQLLFIPLEKSALPPIMQMARTLRHQGYAVAIDFGLKKLKNSLRQADKLGVRFVALLGDEELQKSCLQIKDMQKGTSEVLPFETFLAEFQPRYGSSHV